MQIPSSLQALHLQLGRSISSAFLNSYTNTIRGQWLEFVELRSYVSGDSIKRIDRKTTAKKNETFVKEVEEKVFDIWFVKESNTENIKIKEILYVLGFAALKHGDRIWLLDGTRTLVPSRKREQLRKIVWNIKKKKVTFSAKLRWLFFWKSNVSKKKSIEENLRNVIKKWITGAMIIIVTDGSEINKSLIQWVGQKNKLLWIHAISVAEKTGEWHTEYTQFFSWGWSRLITTDDEFRKRWRNSIWESIHKFQQIFWSVWWKYIALNVDEDIAQWLLASLHQR